MQRRPSNLKNHSKKIRVQARSLVYSMAIDPQNRVWLAEKTNLCHFVNERFTRAMAASETYLRRPAKALGL